MTTILSFVPDLLMTKGGKLIGGKYVGRRYVSTTALLAKGYHYTAGLYLGGHANSPWIRYLKIFRRYIQKAYTLPN
jgi:hypothetical protein